GAGGGAREAGTVRRGAGATTGRVWPDQIRQRHLPGGRGVRRPRALPRARWRPPRRGGGVRLRRHNDPPGHRDDRVCPRYGVAHRLVPAALGPVPGAPAALPRLLRGAPQRAVDALPAQRFHHLHRVRLLVLGDGWHIVWYGHHGVFLAHVAATLDRIPEQVLQGRRPRLRAVLAPDRPGEGRGLSGAPRGLARRAPGADPAARPRERPRSRAASVGGGHFRTGCSPSTPCGPLAPGVRGSTPDKSCEGVLAEARATALPPYRSARCGARARAPRVREHGEATHSRRHSATGPRH
ncbi:unnamed protein product, partial [Prorocentrum cordatum]